MKRAFQQGLLSLILALPAIAGITPNPQEIELGNLIRNDARQRRPQMINHPILNFVARAKAVDLGRRAYFAHADPDGYASNYGIQLAGYGLPASWLTKKDTNYVESLAAAALSPSEVFNLWVGDAAHRAHVMAELAFYQAETYYGVGYAEVPGSPYTYYYVFLSAPPPRNGATILEPYTEWLFSYYSLKQLDGSTDDSDPDGDGIPRITEFALSFNPNAKEVMPKPVFKTAPPRFEWNLPVRADLGTLRAGVQRSTDLTTWTTDGVTRSGNLFQVPASGPQVFVRFEAAR